MKQIALTVFTVKNSQEKVISTSEGLRCLSLIDYLDDLGESQLNELFRLHKEGYISRTKMMFNEEIVLWRMIKGEQPFQIEKVRTRFGFFYKVIAI